MLNFHARFETIHGRRSVVMEYKDKNDPKKDVTIKVAPELGNNLYCFRVGEHEIIHYDDRHALASYYTGNPIIYPIPNRCENCRYTFEGNTYWQMKGGVPVFLHSLVYNENLGYQPPVVTEDGITLETYISVDEGHPIYEGYPFRHTVTLTYRLTKDGFDIVHCVENEDDKALPYGLSYHTFFNKLSGDDGTTLTVPARHMMELNETLLPTGKLLDVSGQSFDLRQPVPLGDLDLDNCFTTVEPNAPVVVDYTTLGLKILMNATDDHTHVQVYTPKGKPFFCAEKQTCSSDVVNLHAKGFEKEAHLLVVQPGERHVGVAIFRYQYNSTM